MYILYDMIRYDKYIDNDNDCVLRTCMWRKCTPRLGLSYRAQRTPPLWSAASRWQTHAQAV